MTLLDICKCLRAAKQTGYYNLSIISNKEGCEFIYKTPTNVMVLKYESIGEIEAVVDVFEFIEVCQKLKTPTISFTEMAIKLDLPKSSYVLAKIQEPVNKAPNLVFNKSVDVFEDPLSKILGMLLPFECSKPYQQIQEYIYINQHGAGSMVEGACLSTFEIPQECEALIHFTDIELLKLFKTVQMKFTEDKKRIAFVEDDKTIYLVNQVDLIKHYPINTLRSFDVSSQLEISIDNSNYVDALSRLSVYDKKDLTSEISTSSILVTENELRFEVKKFQCFETVEAITDGTTGIKIYIRFSDLIKYTKHLKEIKFKVLENALMFEENDIKIFIPCEKSV